MEAKKTITIYLVGYESDPIHGGVSGFDWYPNKESADRDYISTLKTFMNSNQEVYQGQIQIEVAEGYSVTEEEREEITNRIEEFLYENDWSNAFKDVAVHSLSL